MANSPPTGAMCRCEHRFDLRPGGQGGQARGIETSDFPFSCLGFPNRKVSDMARPVRGPVEARSARKSGVVRYVLAISLVLVVIAFVVAYIVVI